MASTSRRFGVRRKRAAEHQILADGRDGLAGADHLEIPERVRCIADQDRAGEFALRYHELLVGTALDVAEQDLLAADGADEIADRKHADARDLQIGRDHAAIVSRVTPGEMPGERTRLLIGR